MAASCNLRPLRRLDRRILSMGLSLCIPLLTGSCNGTTTETNYEASGTWELRFVNTEEPPFYVGDDEDYEVEVLSGRIDLRPDGTCDFQHTFRRTFEEEVEEYVDSAECTWFGVVDIVRVRFSTGGSVAGSRVGPELWFTFGYLSSDFTFVYQLA